MSETHHQENNFEFISNATRDGYWELDFLEQKFKLSSGWKQRLGFKEDEEISYLNFMHLLPEENFFEHHTAMTEVLEGCKNSHVHCDSIHFRIKFPIRTLHGEEILVEDEGDVFFDEDANPIRITGFHKDISEQK